MENGGLFAKGALMPLRWRCDFSCSDGEGAVPLTLTDSWSPPNVLVSGCSNRIRPPYLPRLGAAGDAILARLVSRPGLPSTVSVGLPEMDRRRSQIHSPALVSRREYAAPPRPGESPRRRGRLVLPGLPFETRELREGGVDGFGSTPKQTLRVAVGC